MEYICIQSYSNWYNLSYTMGFLEGDHERTWFSTHNVEYNPRVWSLLNHIVYQSNIGSDWKQKMSHLRPTFLILSWSPPKMLKSIIPPSHLPISSFLSLFSLSLYTLRRSWDSSWEFVVFRTSETPYRSANCSSHIGYGDQSGHGSSLPLHASRCSGLPLHSELRSSMGSSSHFTRV